MLVVVILCISCVWLVVSLEGGGVEVKGVVFFSFCC